MSADKRRHRGAHPEDEKLFNQSCIKKLCTAVYELSWLLSRGYSQRSALKIVGDRHSLSERQRLAVARASSSEQERELRLTKKVEIEQVSNEIVNIDGFNTIITLEAALGGGILLRCPDSCFRDLSSVHGSYRSVDETEDTIILIGQTLELFGPRRVCWYLDKPISNSGRLAKSINEFAERNQWPWAVELVFNPDKAIMTAEGLAVSSDSLVLNDAAKWVNLSAYIIEHSISDSCIVDLSRCV